MVMEFSKGTGVRDAYIKSFYFPFYGISVAGGK